MSSGAAAHPCSVSIQGHPALLAKLIEAVHELHLVLAVHRRGSEG
jgi:hypothetical protein